MSVLFPTLPGMFCLESVFLYRSSVHRQTLLIVLEVVVLIIVVVIVLVVVVVVVVAVVVVGNTCKSW